MSAILGIGLDVVDLRRISRLYDRYGATFVRRFCLPGECRATHPEAVVPHLGGLFAAKEAVLKALGSGWAHGIGFHQVEIRRSEGGRPRVELHRRALAWAERMGVRHVHLSITHEQSYAAAVAIAEGGSQSSAEDNDGIRSTA